MDPSKEESQIKKRVAQCCQSEAAYQANKAALQTYITSNPQ